jgi:NAD(P)-dependent dehydrogenase (short-subunit alcohol dehydrogenase family)
MLGGGDVALVTGSTSGIGRGVALNLAETGATVLVHGRDAESARETVGALLPRLGWGLYGLVGGLFGLTDSPADAAETPTYLATAPAVAAFSGEYFEDREAQRELWTVSVEWTALSDSSPVSGGTSSPAGRERT